MWKMFSYRAVKLQGIGKVFIIDVLLGMCGGGSLNVPFGYYSCCSGHPNNKNGTAIAVKLCWKSRHEIRIPNSPKRALLLLHLLGQAIITCSLGGQRVKTPLPDNLGDDQKH